MCGVLVFVYLVTQARGHEAMKSKGRIRKRNKETNDEMRNYSIIRRRELFFW